MVSESHQPVCGKQSLNGEGNPIHFYPRDAMLARILAMALCLSLCLSVTSRGSIETAEQIDVFLTWELSSTHFTLQM